MEGGGSRSSRPPTGRTFHRDLVRSPGAVAVVPLIVGDDGSTDVVLVRQYRPAFETEMWEIPAGMRDVDGEPPELTAERELVEEAGLRPGTLDLLTRISPSAGLTDSITWIFLATDLEETERDLHGPEEEHMDGGAPRTRRCGRDDRHRRDQRRQDRRGVCCSRPAASPLAASTGR